jgi:hypothetical protein
MSVTPAQIAFAALVSLSLGLLAFAAPSGRLLLAAPDPSHSAVDPSIRASAHHARSSSSSSSSWFASHSSSGGSSWGGGFHGGK